MIFNHLEFSKLIHTRDGAKLLDLDFPLDKMGSVRATFDISECKYVCISSNAFI
jgi:hypothetical protein